MALTLQGSNAASGTSVTLPTHAVGDLILIWAYRDGSTVAPTQPTGGGTVPYWTPLFNGSGGNSNVAFSGWAFATATNHTSGTWTNATGVAAMVFRGAAGYPIGGNVRSNSTGSGPSFAIAVPSITPTKTDGSSMFVSLIGARSATAWATPPAGYTQRAVVNTELVAITKDTTTSDGTFNETVTSASNGWWAEQIEILAYVAPDSKILRRQAAGSGHYGSGGFGAQTATFANAVQSNATLLCFFWGNSNVGEATCADNVNGAWTAVAGQQSPVSGSGRRMNWFYKTKSAAADAGAMTVTVTPNANTGNTESMQIIELSPTGGLDTNITSSGVHSSGLVATQNSGTPQQSGGAVYFGFASDTESAKFFTPGSTMQTIVLDASGNTGGQANGAATMAVAEFLANGASFIAAAMGINVSDDGGKYVIGFLPPAASTPAAGNDFVAWYG